MNIRTGALAIGMVVSLTLCSLAEETKPSLVRRIDLPWIAGGAAVLGVSIAFDT